MSLWLWLKRTRLTRQARKVGQKFITAFLNSSPDSFQSISTSFLEKRVWKDGHICVAFLLFTVVYNKKVNVVKRSQFKF